MGNCKNCKFWDNSHECNAIDYYENEEDRTPTGTELVLNLDYSDDQGLSASIKTGPEFGCVLFQQKEVTP